MMDDENVSPKMLKEWEKEYRKNCRAEMRQYLSRFPDATQEEIRDLREWVRSGHSPYDNGDYISTESGVPMDFINARRFLEDMREEFLQNSEKNLENGSDCESTVERVSSDDALPF